MCSVGLYRPSKRYSLKFSIKSMICRKSYVFSFYGLTMPVCVAGMLASHATSCVHSTWPYGPNEVSPQNFHLFFLPSFFFRPVPNRWYDNCSWTKSSHLALHFLYVQFERKGKNSCLKSLSANISPFSDQMRFKSSQELPPTSPNRRSDRRHVRYFLRRPMFRFHQVIRTALICKFLSFTPKNRS